MSENYFLDESWSDKELLLNGINEKIARSLEYPKNDFIPRDYQSELAHSTKFTNKIIFLSNLKDKLSTTLPILKSLISEVEKSGKRIFYVVHSVESLSLVADFLDKHFYDDVCRVKEELDSESWVNNVKHFRIIVITSVFYLNALSTWITKPNDAYLVLFDDCAYGNGNHSMKQIMNIFRFHLENEWPKIIAFTSSLVHPQIEADDSFEYLKNLEITFKSSIVSSQYCDVIKKFLPPEHVKFVKFRSLKGNIEDLVCKPLYFKNVMGKAISFIDELKFPDNLYSSKSSFKKKCFQIFQDLMHYMYSYGAYPAFVILIIYRVKLEKMKLLNDDSLSFALSAIISDLHVLRSLMWQKLTNCGAYALDSSTVIVRNSNEKIAKLLSLLLKLDNDANCVIFVENCIAARMITFILQKLSKNETKLSRNFTDFIIDCESVYESVYEREKFLFKKHMKTVVKKFRRGMLNTLVISWNTDVEISELSANYIIYFDMPPSYEKYILSRKFANVENNNNFFFLEETGDEERFNKDKKWLEEFVTLDLTLKELFIKKDINDEERLRKSFAKFKESKNELIKKFPPLVTKSKRVHFSDAIDVINGFCRSLPSDGFSSPAPRWSFAKKNGGVVCKLQLPMQSGIKSVIESLPVTNVKFVKQIAALEAVKFLYEAGHLNEDLRSTYSNIDDKMGSEELFPHWKEEDEDIKPGSINCFRTVPLKFPEWFHNSCPQPDQDSYLHIIFLKPVYEKPTESRKLFFHQLMQSSDEFGILTSKKLPQICKFPVYTDLGQVDVAIEVNAKTFRLTEEQIQKLQRCHKFIFLDVLQIVKGFMIGDYSNGDNSYCIVPLTLSDEGSMTIAWNVVNDLSTKNDIVEPSEEERIYTNYSGDNYLGKVVTPWYRMLSQRYYIVTRICTEWTPNTPFPSGEYKTFTEYYDAKYSLEVKQPIQPLLEARMITDNLKCIRPRAQNPGVKKKKGEKEQDHKVILLPEFCIKQPFPAVYWYKSILLVAITHRLHYILLAEEFRRKIALEAQSHAPTSWPDEEPDIMLADESYIKECEESAKSVIPLLEILKQIKWLKNIRRYPWGDEQLPLDVERNLETVSMLEVMSYCDFVRSHKVEGPDPLQGIFIPGAFKFPNLNFLNVCKELSPGPKQSDIVQALTGVACDDIVNLERFKMFGKSFLNFSISLWLYKLHPSLNILQIRRLKRKIMSKRNLYYCGTKLELGSYIKLHDFSENNDWFLTGFCVPELFKNILENSFIPPEVIFNLEIPREEQYSGVISSETRNKIQDKMLDYYNKTSKNNESTLNKVCISDNADHNHAIIYFKKHSVPDKAIANALKALVGVYVTNTGVDSSFKFLQHVGVLKSGVSANDFYETDLKAPEGYSNYGHDRLKVALGYEFENRQLLLEALTHHSYFSDSSVECNYKLAFLGESILDLLITGYMHEYFKETKLGEVRELRVSLMNDVVFAIVAVRLGLHKFLLYDSAKLLQKIDKFVDEEKMMNYKISREELLFLVEETNSAIVDSVDVPRALSDVFKAVIAAVFLDTKGDLKIVWNVVHQAMKAEIDEFIHANPRDPIKYLGETALKLIYGPPTTYGKSSNLIIVPLHFDIDDQKKVFFGVGSSKNQAKRIATKIALKELTREFVV